MILAGEGEDGVFLPMVSAKRKGRGAADTGVLRAVHHQQAGFSILLSGAAGGLSIGLECAGHDECFGVGAMTTLCLCSKRGSNSKEVACRCAIRAAPGAAAVGVTGQCADHVRLYEERLAFHVQPGVLRG